MNQETNESFLNLVFEEIVSIARGRCALTDDYISSHENTLHQKVLEALLLLNQDIELYKVEVREAIESEYKIKILEEKNRQLKQFNYAVSHDLKEPLRTISSFSSLVLRSNRQNLDESGKEYLNYVVDASKRMWNLVTGLLNYSEIGKERILSNVDIKMLVDNICLDLSAQLKDKHINFQIGSLPTIQGFALELRQLFQNLISNAIKFSPPDQLQMIKISYERVVDGHQFSVEDNGIGIEKNQHANIFDIFVRLNGNEEFQGSGIGLALCHRIVTMHNGNIWVESEPGKGSKFSFIISDKLADFQS